jgi:hypothetical protein
VRYMRSDARACNAQSQRRRLSSALCVSQTCAFDAMVRHFPAANLESFRPLYSGSVRKLIPLLTSTAPYVRPTASREAHPFVQRILPEITRDKFGTGILSKSKFAAQAIARVSGRSGSMGG